MTIKELSFSFLLVISGLISYGIKLPHARLKEPASLVNFFDSPIKRVNVACSTMGCFSSQDTQYVFSKKAFLNSFHECLSQSIKTYSDRKYPGIKEFGFSTADYDNFKQYINEWDELDSSQKAFQTSVPEKLETMNAEDFNTLLTKEHPISWTIIVSKRISIINHKNETIIIESNSAELRKPFDLPWTIYYLGDTITLYNLSLSRCLETHFKDAKYFNYQTNKFDFLKKAGLLLAKEH